MTYVDLRRFNALRRLTMTNYLWLKELMLPATLQHLKLELSQLHYGGSELSVILESASADL